MCSPRQLFLAPKAQGGALQIGNGVFKRLIFSGTWGISETTVVLARFRDLKSVIGVFPSQILASVDDEIKPAVKATDATYDAALSCITNESDDIEKEKAMQSKTDVEEARQEREEAVRDAVAAAHELALNKASDEYDAAVIKANKARKDAMDAISSADVEVDAAIKSAREGGFDIDANDIERIYANAVSQTEKQEQSNDIEKEKAMQSKTDVEEARQEREEAVRDTVDAAHELALNKASDEYDAAVIKANKARKDAMDAISSADVEVDAAIKSAREGGFDIGANDIERIYANAVSQTEKQEDEDPNQGPGL